MKLELINEHLSRCKEDIYGLMPGSYIGRVILFDILDVLEEHLSSHVTVSNRISSTLSVNQSVNQ